MKNSMAVPKKTKCRNTLWSSNSTCWNMFRRIEIKDLKRYLHIHAHSSTFHHSRKVETTPIHRWMGEQNMVHFYNDLLFSLEKKGNSHICNTWVNLQDIMLSEIVKWSETQSCLTLCDPTDYTVHGILQARILEWVAFPFSRGSSQPMDRTQVSRIAGRFFTSWVIREACNKGSEISQLQKTNYYMIPFIPGIQGSQIQRRKIKWQVLRGQGKERMWSCYLMDMMGIPGGASGKEPTGQCRSQKRHGFNPCVGKISWRRPWQPTPVFLPGEPPWTEEPGRLQSVGSHGVRQDWSDLAQQA